MEIVRASNAEDAENPHGVSSKLLYTTEGMQVTMVTLEPGEALKLHTTSINVHYFILEGEGDIEIDGRLERIAHDDLIVTPAGTPHRLLNNKTSGALRFLVVKALILSSRPKKRKR